MYEKDASKDVGYANVTDEDAFGAPPFRRFRLFYFILLTVLSTCASIYLLYTLIAKKFFKVHFYIFVGHLAVMYIIFGVFIIPLYIVMFETNGVWPLGQVTCVAWQVISNLCTYEMEVMVVVIALDRLWAIYWPYHYRIHRNYQNLAGTLVVSWLYSGLTVLPTLIHDRLTVIYNVTVCDVSIKENYFYWRSTISMGFLTPAAAAITLYFLIACKVAANIISKRRKVAVVINGLTDRSTVVPTSGGQERRLNVVGTTPGYEDNENGLSRKRQEKVKVMREKRVLFVVLVVLFNYVICLLPYAVYCGLWFFDYIVPNRIAFTVCHMLMYSHPALDALAFILSNSELRPGFCSSRNLFCKPKVLDPD